MRKAIDEYALKNERPPQSLNDLVDGNFLRAIPAHPITLKADWVGKFDDVELAAKQEVCMGLLTYDRILVEATPTASRTTAAISAIVVRSRQCCPTEGSVGKESV
jgi:hypothetical protein